MFTEFDVLKDVIQKFEKLGIKYMLTGSLAMSYYAQPRMTRDIDLVVEIPNSVVRLIEKIFKDDYYISMDAVADAIENFFIFNIIHIKSSVKVDCIVRKQDEYRKLEFGRRVEVNIKNFEVSIVSKEDLIISKLFWIQQGDSELQKRDVINLLKTGFDKEYLLNWLKRLNLENILNKIKNA